MSDSVRIVPYALASGPMNMARDEAILESVAAGTSPATLRVYGWHGRWVSIGMSQPIAEVDLAACRSTDTGVMRRPSGGTAVLHEAQIGWSLALPADHPLAIGDIVASYRFHAGVTLKALECLGVTARAVEPDVARQPLPDPLLKLACFGSLAPHEIVVGEDQRKLVGWGQVRRRGVVMHHAVMSLRFEPRDLAALLDADQDTLTRALTARIAGLSDVLEPEPCEDEVVAAIERAYAGLAAATERGPLTASESCRADQLAAEKYGACGWTARR